jgi:hypothetical protein
MTDEPTRGRTRDAVTTSTVDPPEATGTPVVMTDAYVQIDTANLSCFGMEVSIEPENKPVEIITFCGVQDFPGPTKWHLKCKFVQSFATGSVDATLSAALSAYTSAGTPATFRVRPYKSQAVGPTNPSYEGSAIPQPYIVFGGAAGAASEVDIDWILTAPPSKVTA